MIAREFFEIDESGKFVEYFGVDENPVLWLKKINFAILDMLSVSKGTKQNIPPGCHIGKDVFIHESVQLPPICVIEGPAYIDEGTSIRPFAYVRENVIIGKNCLIGNSCELKNSILLHNTQVPHFNYVGDSVLGNFVHLGAGVILANLRLDRKNIITHYNGERVETGMKKVGAIIGDRSEISCNSVLNPGTILPKNSMVVNGQIKKVLGSEKVTR
ncbi:MAG: UDP-N-acetylglucosamine diphosphorylase [Puniceicoccales bacterium]|jgi:NDP-sugar pyrophosphorylase family protein|nr:UDP-N-acetylglucosamine diphosphorylase [Puniceicoccales bacterium]